MNTKKKKCRGLLSLLFCGILFFAICTSVSAAETVKMVKLGNNVALSGGAAFWGVSYDKAHTLAAKQINDKGGFVVKGQKYKWEVIAYDNKYDPAEAVSVANKLIYQEKVKYMTVLGSVISMAVAPITNKEKVLQACWASGGKALTNAKNPLVFRHSPVDETASATGLYKWLIAHEKIKSIGTLQADDDGGHSGGEGCKAAAEFTGLKLLGQQYYPRTTNDFYPVLTRLISQKPDCIDMLTSMPSSVLLITKQLYELGYKGVIVQYTVDPVKALQTVGPKALEGVYSYLTLADLVTPEQKKFQKDYMAAYGDWNEQGLLAYDFLFTLTECIIEGQTFDPVKIADLMEDKEIPYLYGKGYYGMKEKFGLKRQGLFPSPLARFKNGKWQHVEFIEPVVPTSRGK